MLGPGWDEERVAPVPPDVAVDAGIDSAEERLREARRQHDDVAQLAEDARLERGAAARAKSAAPRRGARDRRARTSSARRRSAWRRSWSC